MQRTWFHGERICSGKWNSTNWWRHNCVQSTPLTTRGECQTSTARGLSVCLCICVSGGLCRVLCYELGQLQLHIFIGQRALANKAQILSEWTQAMKSSSGSQTPSPWSGRNIIRATLLRGYFGCENLGVCVGERGREKKGPARKKFTWGFLPTFFCVNNAILNMACR